MAKPDLQAIADNPTGCHKCGADGGLLACGFEDSCAFHTLKCFKCGIEWTVTYCMASVGFADGAVYDLRAITEKQKRENS